jgi:2'-5' RNA ligase superfamily
LLGRLREETRTMPPPAMIDGLMSLGYGVAYRVRSSALEAVRANLAEAFADLLIPQDRAAWRPHVTIQNKAKPAIAKALLAKLEAQFQPRPLIVAGLAAWHYRGGPWLPIAAYRFGGGHSMKVPPPLIAS